MNQISSLKTSPKPAATSGALSLESLLDPVTIDEFREKYWEKDFLFISRGDPDFYKGLFSLADVDRCLLSRATDSRQSLTVVPPAQSPEKPAHHRVSEIGLDHLYAAFNSGSTLRLQHVQDSWAPVAVLASAIEEALSVEINVNFYLTPSDSQGFAVHYDPHDVFILQTDGAKEWYVYEPDISLPVERKMFQTLPEIAGYNLDEDSARLSRKLRLEAGDLLYIPRGFPHKAVASGAASLHLTVGIHPTYWLEFLKMAIERACVEEPELRRSLDPGYLGDPAVRDKLGDEFGRLLRAACEKASFEKTMAHLAEEKLAERRFPPDGHFTDLVELGELEIDDVVRRRPGLGCRVEDHGGTVALRFGANNVEAPSAISAAFEYVRDTPRFRVADLPGLSEKSRLVLTRRLISEGLLTRAAD